MSDSQPLVSVIMPIRNEADFIARSLGAVLVQDYPHNRLEIFVADGMSTDNTPEIVRELTQSCLIPVTIIENPGKIVPTGFNAALAQAHGEIIVRVDGHTILAPDYIRTCVETLERTAADNVGGRMNAIGRSRLGKAVALATSSPFGVGGARFHYSDKEESVDTVYMGSWRREVFERIGLFDEELVRNQDDEFNYRLRSYGGTILLNPAIRSEYYNRSTLYSLARQYFQYGYYKVRVMQKHPRQMQPRQFAPVALVIILFSGALFTPFNGVIKYLWLAALGTYVFALLAASIVTSVKSGWQYLTLLPITFATLHLSYGLGFLNGLWTFRGRWQSS